MSTSESEMRVRVRDFQFLVTDDRYSVPTLLFVEVKDAEAARAIAQRLQQEHKHYHAIEVWDADKRLFTVSEPTGSVAAFETRSVFPKTAA